MKRLILVRHAKSSWKDLELRDFDRPLNKRGKRDAPFMGKLLAGDQVMPDLIISSPAKRAFSTAKKIAAEIGYPLENILTHKRLYESDTDDFINVFAEVDDSVETLMIFSHNPGLTILNNFLSDKRIDNIPTCGIVTIDLKIKSWKKIDFDQGVLISFDYPKKFITETEI